MERDLFVQMRTLPNERWPEHKQRHLSVPIEIFCWFRLAIGEVFVENGEAEIKQQLGVPPNLTQWMK